MKLSRLPVLLVIGLVLGALSVAGLNHFQERQKLNYMYAELSTIKLREADKLFLNGDLERAGLAYHDAWRIDRENQSARAAASLVFLLQRDAHAALTFSPDSPAFPQLREYQLLLKELLEMLPHSYDLHFGLMASCSPLSVAGINGLRMIAGSARRSKGNAAEALKLHEKVLAEFPDCAAAHQEKAFDLSSLRGIYYGIEYLNSTLPFTKGGRERAKILVARGHLERLEHSTTRLQHTIAAARGQDPNDCDLLDLESELAWEAAKKSPGSRQGSEAANSARMASLQCPFEPYYLARWARLEAKTGSKDLARRAFARVLQLQRGIPGLRVDYARLELERRNFAGAETLLKEEIVRNPQSPHARKLLDELQADRAEKPYSSVP